MKQTYDDVLRSMQPLVGIAQTATLEDVYDDEDEETRTMYFTASKALVQDKYPDAEATDIAIEFPISQPEACASSVMFGPIKDGSTYDWYDIDLPYEEIEALIALGERSLENHNNAN